jgi:hypothetical protein
VRLLARHRGRVLEKLLILVQLLRNFDFEVVDPAKPWNSGNVGLWIQHGLWVRVTERVEPSTT